MRRGLWCVPAAVVAAVAVAAAQPGTTTSVTAAASVDRVLADAVGRGDVPGIVAMVTDRRGIVYRGAFGLADSATSRRLDADAIFRIASMTKPITSTALMQLVEQGKVRLDEPAGTYVADLRQLPVFSSFDEHTGAYAVHPASTPLTVRHLLTHTSGFAYNFTSPIVRDFKAAPGEHFAAGPLLFEPGERWFYGTSTDWVGRVVEAVSGVTLDEYFRAHILEPLRMHDTYFNVPATKQARMATLHRRDETGRLTADAPTAPPPTTRFSGGGGLSSTAADYVRFIQMVLNDGVLDGVRVLSTDSVAQMVRNQIGPIGVRALKTALPRQSSDFTFIADGRDKWGLGFLITADHVAGKRSAGSLSWGGIDNTYFWIDREQGVGGVILMQFLPFADAKALAVYDGFERAAYQLVASRAR